MTMTSNGQAEPAEDAIGVVRREVLTLSFPFTVAEASKVLEALSKVFPDAIAESNYRGVTVYVESPGRL